MLWAHTFQEASLALQRGEPDRAEELATKALEIGTASEEPEAFTYYGSQLMCARDQQGRLSELVDLIADVAEQNPGMPVYGAILALGPQRVRRRSNRPSALRRGRGTWLRPSPRQHLARQHDLLREHRCPAPPPRALRRALRSPCPVPRPGALPGGRDTRASGHVPRRHGRRPRAIRRGRALLRRRPTSSTSAVPCAMPRRRPICGGDECSWQGAARATPRERTVFSRGARFGKRARVRAAREPGCGRDTSVRMHTLREKGTAGRP